MAHSKTDRIVIAQASKIAIKRNAMTAIGSRHETMPGTRGGNLPVGAGAFPTIDLILRSYSAKKSREALLFEAEHTEMLVGRDPKLIGEQDKERRE